MKIFVELGCFYLEVNIVQVKENIAEGIICRVWVIVI
jgi:hypothetical protein